MRALALLVALGLAGCASSEEIARRNAAAQAAVIAQDNAYCASIGAAPGELNHSQCRLALLQRRDQQTAAEEARRRAASQALIAAGAALSGPQPTFLEPQQNILPQQTRCRSTRDMTGTVQTVCQ